MSDRLAVPCTSVAALTVALAASARGSPDCSIPVHECATSTSLGRADEADSQRALGPTCDDCCPTDPSLDGVTDSADLGLLLACWGSLLPGCECADLKGDGSVDGADVGVLLAAWGPCPSEITCACEASDHDCHSTGTPGCTDMACCEAICAVDRLCCVMAWDGVCVNEAFSICGVPVCSFECPTGAVAEPERCGEDTDGGCTAVVIGNSDCCIANGGIGCDDPTCQEAVCAVDSFCCTIAWDGICAGEALTLCPEVCVQGKPAFAAITCGQTICGSAWADGGLRDTDWYEIQFNQIPATEITFSIATTLSMVIGIVDTGGIPDCSPANALNPFVVAGFCGMAEFQACLPPGAYWFFAAPIEFSGFPCGTQNAYAITLACGAGY